MRECPSKSRMSVGFRAMRAELVDIWTSSQDLRNSSLSGTDLAFISSFTGSFFSKLVRPKAGPLLGFLNHELR